MIGRVGWESARWRLQHSTKSGDVSGMHGMEDRGNEGSIDISQGAALIMTVIMIRTMSI